MGMLEVRKGNNAEQEPEGSSASLPESEAVPQMDGACPFCGEPTEKEGVTCDEQCYYLWYAHYNLQRYYGVVILAEGERVPLTLKHQPWYVYYANI